MKIVSACLAGIKCRWDGKARPCLKVIELVKQGKAIPVCPEQLGGLTTPRTPAEQKNDKIFTKDGKDVTAQFERGAEEALKIAKLANCNEAIVKSKSSSCGSGKVYDGTFSGKLINGDGVFAKILKKNNIKLFTENEI
ncbi:MAG: DUF523 domain-containing protein [Nanoarchaeota archaeon]|nr:DUF523 domain-containing protein [Nanoarchaeota archaeon]MBU4352312.1 DUF523 domain-containing protein [Nanoarchaeota archaeon]MBU4456051.1 DUF523 domain-containing protein [Nanoarchaeota archaeon]MCG2719856.1 DUF523 domain-containing protein [Nanoarchaeota archaeon]